MTSKNPSLLALIVLICGPSAQARQAALMSFDQTVVPTTPFTAIEDRVGNALRFHLQSIAQSEVQIELPARDRMPRRLEAARQVTPSWQPNAPHFPALYLQSACEHDKYAPAWWLQPEVEVRRSAHYDSMASIACEFGVPPHLLDAVITQESGYKSWAVSSAGATGIMQIMPGTARHLRLANPFDPIANMRAGARYLRQQLDRFGRVDLALAAYNAGPDRRSLRAGYVPAIPETLQYVRAITTNWSRLAQLGQIATEPMYREQIALTAIRATGYREVEFIRYDGLNSANPM